MADCTICHDFLNGIYGGGGIYGNPAPPLPPTGYNLRWVKTSINGSNVKFIRFFGPPVMVPWQMVKPHMTGPARYAILRPGISGIMLQEHPIR